MNTPFSGAVPRRTVPRILAALLLVIAAGCVRYRPEPIVADEFLTVLEERTPKLSETGRTSEHDATDGLTLEEAEVVALYLNPRLRVARANAGIASASAKHAGLWDDPEIGADALRILEDVDEPWILGASLSFSIPVSGRLAVAKDLARAEERVAVVEAWVEEQSVLLELRQTWAAFDAATRGLAIGRELHDRLSQLLIITDKREELGETTATESIAFRLADARLALELEDIKTEQKKQRLRLLELLGLLPETPIEFSHTESVGFDASGFDSARIDAVSPMVVLAAARYEAAEQSLRLEIRQQYPDISLGPIFEKEEGMDRLGMGFSVPIPILNANRQAIAAADASRDAARADWERAFQQAVSELARGRVEHDAARRRVETLRSVVVPLASSQMEQARAMAEIGEINTLLILEAIQSEREVALELIEAEAALATAHANLRATIPAETDIHKNYPESNREDVQGIGEMTQ